MPKSKTVIVQSQQGTGKGLHARRIVKALGLDQVIEDWAPGNTAPPRHGALVLTHTMPDNVFARRYRVMSLDEALQAAAAVEAASENSND